MPSRAIFAMYASVPREELFVRNRYLPPIARTYRRKSSVPSKSVSLK